MPVAPIRSRDAQCRMFQEDESVLSRPTPDADEVVAYGSHADQIADVRFDATRSASRPLVLLIHGGFWRPAYDRAHTGPMAAAIAAAGWTVASVEYRRIPGNPDATFEDIKLALAGLRRRVANHNGSVLLVGHSAGGHLALWAASIPEDHGLRGVVALAPAADLQRVDELHLSNDAVREFLGTEPAKRPDADPAQLRPAVPVTLVHGEEDTTVPVGVTESYAAKHPEARVLRIATCGHYALIDPVSAAWPRVIAEMARFDQGASLSSA